MGAEVRDLPQVAIGKVAGFARGAGNEFLMYLDMRFAAIGRSGQAQPESTLAILPGGGGTVNMTRLLCPPTRSTPSSTPWPAGWRGYAPRSSPRSRPPSGPRRRPAPDTAYAVENASLYSLFTEDMVEVAREQLAAGVQTREGERNLEGLVDSLSPGFRHAAQQ